MNDTNKTNKSSNKGLKDSKFLRKRNKGKHMKKDYSKK